MEKKSNLYEAEDDEEENAGEEEEDEVEEEEEYVQEEEYVEEEPDEENEAQEDNLDEDSHKERNQEQTEDNTTIPKNGNQPDQEAQKGAKKENMEKGIKEKLAFLDLDLESMPKDELINLLLKPEEEKKKKKKYAFTPKKPFASSFINNPNTVFNQMQKLNENQDPELHQDFNVALTKILAKMVKDSNNPNQEIYDILISDREKVEEELGKYDFTKKVSMENKIKNWIDKKNKNLEIIQEKVNEEFQKNCTFTPIVNNDKKINKRNLGQFLVDQEKYQKKLTEKISMLKDINIKQNTSELTQVPKINTVSKKIVEEKLKTEGGNTQVHERLYKKRNENSKNEMQKPKSTTPRISKALEERTQSLYQDAVKRKMKQKEKEEEKESIMKKARKENKVKSTVNSNKYIFKKFKKQFRTEVEKLLSAQDGHNVINKFNYGQLNQFLVNMNFLSKDQNEDENDYISTSDANTLLSKNIEKRLLAEMHENLKDSAGYVNLDHLFIFCLSILNLLEYYIVKSYNLKKENLNTNFMSTTSSKTAQSSLNSPLVGSPDEPSQEFINKVNLDLNSRINVPRKYGGFDDESNFIISFTHANQIFKDFYPLSWNWSKYNKRKTKAGKTDTLTFKPNINPKSVQLSNKYRQKVINQLGQVENEPNPNDENSDRHPQTTSSSKINNEVDPLQIHALNKKRLDKLNEKIRQENEIKELENCTFKPKINNYNFKATVYPVDCPKEQIIERLYKTGTESLMNKKGKTKDDLEIEKYGKEYTFKPNIHERDFNELFATSKNEISNRDMADIQKFNERLKRGRLDREVKESFFKRGEEIKSPMRNYETNQRTKSESKVILTKHEAIPKDLEKRKKSPMQRNNINDKYQQYLTQNISSLVSIKEEEPQRIGKSQIPLLIIDVNMKPGVKKKVYVMEGDTAEQLASKFAKENDLDSTTREKLKSLIQFQMNRLLVKIDEEDSHSRKGQKSNK